ncbi:MAG: S8 family serine peptidase [Thaumarchaeota archaeon]|nr:S8 family serine peptidase [Nitrososphaerota archaeon]
MPQAAMVFFIALVSVVFVNAYALNDVAVSLESGLDGIFDTTMFDSDIFHSIFDSGFDSDTFDNAIFDTEIFRLDPSFFESAKTKRYVIFGTGQPDASLVRDSAYGVRSDGGFFYVAALSESKASRLLSQGYHVIEDFELDFYQSTDASRIGQITGYDAATEKYDLTGKGITVGIVDTGVDFSNPDIRDSLARDELNHPLMLDPDGQGIVITNSTFFAFIDNDGIIRNYSKPIPDGFTSSVYQTRDGIFLDLNQDGKGTDIPVYNSFYPLVGQFPTFNGTITNDMKIGNSNRDYIRSQSGAYHLGIIYQGALQGPYTGVQVVPVLVVDSTIPGLYDTIIPDMTTSWEDFTRADLKEGEEAKYDFDFTDEKPIVLGSGNEFLIYDSDADGKVDYSAGTVGAHVLDVYSVISNKTANVDSLFLAVNGTLLEPLDPDGNFFGVMSDFAGHGTSSAATIASQGTEEYNIYNDTQKHTLRGAAPGVKILPIKALWFGDTIYSWLWAAGFENMEQHWNFTGKPRVDIISNSWGVSNFPAIGSVPGMDVLSLVVAALATPGTLHDDFGGITMITSAGNSGHGYGTMGTPNSSPLGITVGATTNNVFVGYGPFEGQPRFGNSTAHHSHVVDFSSRGPSAVGDPKPDLVSVGAYGFVPSNMLKMSKDSREDSFTLYGGTSMSAPIVAGNAAVLMEGLHNMQIDYTPYDIKNILMSTAKDLGNDSFTQGAGLSDVETALDFVHAREGLFIVYNDASYQNIQDVLSPAISAVNSTRIGLEQFTFPQKPIPMMSWFAGHLMPGEYSTATFTIKNPTTSPIEVLIRPQELSLLKQDITHNTTEPRIRDISLNQTSAFVPNYVNLSDVKLHQSMAGFFERDEPIPPESSLLVLDVNFLFNDFMNKTADTFADDLKISSLYLYDWVDENENTRISTGELSLVSRAGSWGTVQELRISDPAEKFEGKPVVGIYPVPTRFSYWLGNTGQNSTAMDYTLTASYYQKDRWQVLWPESEKVIVPPEGMIQVDVNLVVPTDFQTGTYQGFLAFQGEHHTANVPVSFAVVEQVYSADSLVFIPGAESGDVLSRNGEIRGAFDMAGRYMAGDWQRYYFEINNTSINSGAIEISWENPDTNLAVFAVDPQGKIIQTNMPSGVFGEFLGWPSLDWLGNSPFSQGGGFFPVKNKNDTSTVLFVPINQTGTYTLLAHSTLFAGNSTAEPISLVARFSDISGVQDVPVIFDDVIDAASVDDSVDDSANDSANVENVAINPNDVSWGHVSDDTLGDVPSDTPSFVTSAGVAASVYIPTESTPESLIFNYGLAIGVGVGIAIGLVSVLVVKKSAN